MGEIDVHGKMAKESNDTVDEERASKNE